MKVKCKVCGNTSAQMIDDIPLALKNSNNVYHGAHCSVCNSISYHPTPSEESLKAHYSSDYNFYQGGNPKQIARGIGFTKLYLKPHSQQGVILDVGCASADFLYGIAVSSNWECWGVDINKESTSNAKQRTRLNIIYGNIFSNELPEKHFDVLHIRDVIEHVPDPISFFRRARSLLKDDGIIYVRIPNGTNEYSAKRKSFSKTGLPVVSTPGHIFYISPKGFEALCQTSGLQVKKKYSDGFKNGLRNLGLWPFPKLRKARKIKCDTPKVLQKMPDMNNILVSKALKRYLSEEQQLKTGISKFALEHVYLLSPKN